MSNRRIVFPAVAIILLAHASCAQEVKDSTVLSHNKTPWYLKRRTFVTAGVATQTLLTTLVEYQWWWKGNYHAFQFENDGFWNNYSLGVDKIGHFYTSYFYFNALHEVLLYGDYSSQTADWISGGITFFYALSIELGDGYSNFAFSSYDLAANTLGMAFAFARHRVPFLQNFQFKWSYYPSGIIPFDGYWRLTDDYDGHIYWLSVNVHNLLPTSLQEYWPRFLNLAVGYGGENLSSRPPWVNGTPISSAGPMRRKWVVSLDYNLTSIPTTSGMWSTVERIFDMIHFPAPAIRMVDGKPAEFRPLLLN